MAAKPSIPPTFPALLVIVLTGAGGAPVAAQDTAKGAALMAEARSALGSQERLGAVRTLDVRGDFKRALGPANVEGDLQIRLEVPDKLRRDEDVSLPGGGPAMVQTEVLNGTTVWEENSGRAGFIGRFGRGDGGRGFPGGGGGRAAIDPAQLEDAQRRARQTELARFLLVWLLATDAPAVWMGTAESPEGKADVLEITPVSGPPTRLFLDQASHMPLMITWQGAAPQLFAGVRRGRGAGRGDGTQAAPPPPRAEQATLRMTLGEYKAVNGVKLPHLITRGINDMTIEEWAIDSYRINPSFRADVFTR